MALPLENVRILDFTIMMQGPHGTMMLGDLGAEVIKVERPARLGGPSGRVDERYGLHGGYGKNPAENTWYASAFSRPQPQQEEPRGGSEEGASPRGHAPPCSDVRCGV